MSGFEVIIPTHNSQLLDGFYGVLKLEVVKWIEERAGPALERRPFSHFITRPGSWYYERHPRMDLGSSSWSDRAREADQTWDCFFFEDRSIALLFKLTWGGV